MVNKDLNDRLANAEGAKLLSIRQVISALKCFYLSPEAKQTCRAYLNDPNFSGYNSEPRLSI